MEEKIYRKQVFKAALSRAPTKPGVAFRYFTKDELSDLFSLDPTSLARSDTAAALEAAHPGGALAAAHAAWGDFAGLPGVAAVSDHGLLYSRDGEGRVGPHVPPAPLKEKKPAARRGGAGRGRGASSLSTPVWPPGATPRPPQRTTAGRGRGRGGRGRGGGRARPQRPEDVIVDAAVGALGGLLGRAFRWGARVLSPKPDASGGGGGDDGGWGVASTGEWDAAAAAAAPPPPPPPPPATPAELTATIAKMEALLADPGLRLPDGGAAARRKLDEARVALAAAAGGGGGGGTYGFSGSAPAWGAGAAPPGAFRG